MRSLCCGKTRVLWELLFSVFKVEWVIQSMVRETFWGDMALLLEKSLEGSIFVSPLGVLEREEHIIFSEYGASCSKAGVFVFVELVFLVNFVYRKHF